MKTAMHNPRINRTGHLLGCRWGGLVTTNLSPTLDVHACHVVGEGSMKRAEELSPFHTRGCWLMAAAHMHRHARDRLCFRPFNHSVIKELKQHFFPHSSPQAVSGMAVQPHSSKSCNTSHSP